MQLKILFQKYYSSFSVFENFKYLLNYKIKILRLRTDRAEVLAAGPETADINIF